MTEPLTALYAGTTRERSSRLNTLQGISKIENMIDNGLTGLDFSDLVSVPDEVIDRHTAKEEQTVTLMSDASEVQDIPSPADDVQAITLKYKIKHFPSELLFLLIMQRALSRLILMIITSQSLIVSPIRSDF